MVDSEVQINMKIGNIELKNKLILAPLAGYTNHVYRKICHDMGAALTYTEMISDKGLLYENDKTWEYTRFLEEERPIAIQLFGGDKDDLIKATKMVCNEAKPDFIDLNMGCPVKKVLKQGAGSAYLQDVDKIYERFPRLAERKNQIAGTLSGGEQQMLAMGRAMMSHPKLLMLDEPSMGLSPLLVDQVFEIIKDINKDGTTILLVEQNAGKSLAISDRAYVLENGSIVLSGTGKELAASEMVRKAYLGG